MKFLRTKRRHFGGVGEKRGRLEYNEEEEVVVPKQLLECPICSNVYCGLSHNQTDYTHYDRRALIVCSRGHTVCADCSYQIHPEQCPICRQNLMQEFIPDVTLQSIADRVPGNTAEAKPEPEMIPDNFINASIGHYDPFLDNSIPQFSNLRDQVMNQYWAAPNDQEAQRIIEQANDLYEEGILPSVYLNILELLLETSPQDQGTAEFQMNLHQILIDDYDERHPGVY